MVFSDFQSIFLLFFSGNCRTVLLQCHLAPDAWWVKIRHHVWSERTYIFCPHIRARNSEGQKNGIGLGCDHCFVDDGQALDAGQDLIWFF